MSLPTMKILLVEAGIFGKLFGKDKQQEQQPLGIIAKKIVGDLQGGRPPKQSDWKPFIQDMARKINFDELEAVYQAGKESGKLVPQQFHDIAKILDDEYGYKTDISKEIEKLYGTPTGPTSRLRGPTTSRYGSKLAIT